MSEYNKCNCDCHKQKTAGEAFRRAREIAQEEMKRKGITYEDVMKSVQAYYDGED